MTYLLGRVTALLDSLTRRYHNGEYLHPRRPSRLTPTQSALQYNGGSVIAMVGKDCVAIASDLRLGTEALGISSNFQRVLDCQFFPVFRRSLLFRSFL